MQKEGERARERKEKVGSDRNHQAIPPEIGGIMPVSTLHSSPSITSTSNTTIPFLYLSLSLSLFHSLSLIFSLSASSLSHQACDYVSHGSHDPDVPVRDASSTFETSANFWGLISPLYTVPALFRSLPTNHGIQDPIFLLSFPNNQPKKKNMCNKSLFTCVCICERVIPNYR